MKNSVASLQAKCAFESNLSFASDRWTTDAVYYPSLETGVVIAKGRISEIFIRMGSRGSGWKCSTADRKSGPDTGKRPSK